MATTAHASGPVLTDSKPASLKDDARTQLLRRLRGSRIEIPDLQCLMSHWPQGVSPDIERLNEDVENMLESIFPSSKDKARLCKMKGSNIAALTASWWAYAPFNALRTATYLSIWLFAWDDEIDSHEFSHMINDPNAASRFRERTISYLQASLSRSPESKLSDISTNPIITCFKPVAEEILRSYNENQIKNFLDELLFFINMCEEEHTFQNTPYLPTTADYTRRRMGSSAVRVCLAMTEYVFNLDKTNANTIRTNDILSIKKEVAQSQVDTLIPLLLLELGSAQAAVNYVVDIIRSSIKQFELAEKRILERQSYAPNIQADIRKFIVGCKYACTANLKWSLTSGRYQLNCHSMKGGIHVTL
ncbi:terpenoid synthase [Xylariaceae sp. FL0662B]|nr:terpenoid synthase [Xylariaceae sp. FL0662B]